MKRATLGLMVLLIAMAGLAVDSNAAVSLTQKVEESEFKLKIFGFSQFDMRTRNNVNDHEGLYFQAQRIRIGTMYSHENVFGFLLVDFNQPHDKRDAGLPKVIKDAFVGYRFNDAAFIRMGMIKAPSGMTFTTHSWNLDIAERNHLDKGLVLERDFGIMLSGRQIGFGDDSHPMSGIEVGHEQHGGFGFGYDIGVFNPAGRCDAVVWDESIKGDALAYAGRLHYDYGLPLHVEASYGVSENAGGGPDSMGVETEDYSVFTSGINSLLLDHKLNFKAEYLYGQNIRGVDDWDQYTYSLMAGYMVAPTLEGVIKVYVANSEKMDVETSLTNVYFGVNFFIDPLVPGEPHMLQKHRVQLNYVLVDGDQKGSVGTYNGLGGHMDDTWILQWQYVF
ncbi:MAG: hypothetical protein KAV42_04285 [Candidatus Krumholzibacteria bacterium]|nr:hypothetical protein [Candidatus Krumholzibacteria bacterium]